MKNQTEGDRVSEASIRSQWKSLFRIGKRQPTDSEGRSKPLTSDYNSTSIVLVVTVAAILAVVLWIWI